MKYFGTDGIRGKINEKLTVKLLNKVAKAIVLYYKHHNLNKVLIVGNDSRITSDYILSIISAKLLKNGIEIHNIGLCSSPCLAFLTKKFNYPLGLMLSASHNPAEYNGLKFFNNLGEKVDDTFEIEFEQYMDKKTSLKNDNFSVCKSFQNLKQTYIEHLKSIIKFDFPCIFDCANGGVSEICKSVFPKQSKININPSGHNINKNAGCTQIEMLKNLCVKKQKIGFAFDGDGDRVHVVDTDGTIITGDKILYVLSRFFQNSNDVCVGTIYSNIGLENSLKKRKIELKRSDVGDKKVYELMTATKSILGGEDAGHIILKTHMNTGDGLLIAIIFANIINLSQKSIKDLLKDYYEYYQVRKDIKINENINYKSILSKDTIENISNQFKNSNAKIIIRPSGTEPVIRLFVEHKNKDIAEKIIETIKKQIYELLQA